MAHIPSLFRGLVAAIWFGIQTYLGALALSGIVEYLTGFDNWALWYVIFAVVQIINTALGIKAVEFLSSIAAPAIIAISVWMYLTLDVLAVTKGVNIWTFVGDKQLTIITLFLANVAFWSTLAIDIPNITRYVRTPVNARGFLSRNRHIFLAQLVALPLTQTWIAVIGAASFVAAGDWNQSMSSGPEHRAEPGRADGPGGAGTVVDQYCSQPDPGGADLRQCWSTTSQIPDCSDDRGSHRYTFDAVGHPR